MHESPFELEQNAYLALGKLMKDAKVAKGLFEDAGLPIPAPLARMLSEGDDGGKKDASSSVSVPRMKTPKRPAEATDEWVSISVHDAKPISLVRAVLRRAGAIIKPKEIVDRIAAFRPDLGAGSIYNTGPRLEKSGIISRYDDGWGLLDWESGPIVEGDAMWGVPDVLQTHEMAAHRRQVIVHLLGVYKSGLQIVQLVERLKGFSQCKAPVSKDLIKADLQAMQEDKRVRRAGNSKKWILAPA